MSDEFATSIRLSREAKRILDEHAKRLSISRSAVVELVLKRRIEIDEQIVKEIDEAMRGQSKDGGRE